MNKIELEKISPRELIPGYFVKFVHSERMTVSFWDIRAGAVMPEHTHPNEQVANCISGQLELTVEGKVQHLGPGTSVVIPPNAKHSAIAKTDCRMIDVFCPVREDYR
jgi:quercetin dioxygenase-like cupin family protein